MHCRFELDGGSGDFVTNNGSGGLVSGATNWGIAQWPDYLLKTLSWLTGGVLATATSSALLEADHENEGHSNAPSLRASGHRSATRYAVATMLMVAFFGAGRTWAATTGTISGTVTDAGGNGIPGVAITITNTAQGTKTEVKADEHGDFLFPSVQVGTYDILFEAKGFRAEKRTGLVIDTNAAVNQSLTMQVAKQEQEVTVTGTAGDVEVNVETASTQMGDVVAAKTMTEVALNGRSFTDLLALQPGIVPMSTQTGDSVIMAGASVQIQPSGGLNAGNQSISGQREDANGYLVNGGDVKEMMNGGTTIIPNLDSIAEFRVLTNNFDAEFGNYSGGIVNVITKSGGNQIHGSAFEFLRNTDLDARNFFSPERSFYRQNQFGGTVGGPIRQNKIFYFGDYQATRSNQGIDTGLISVPSAAERAGNFSDIASQLSGTVSASFRMPSFPSLPGLLRPSTCCNTSLRRISVRINSRLRHLGKQPATTREAFASTLIQTVTAHFRPTISWTTSP
jgi:hypothetical protein